MAVAKLTAVVCGGNMLAAAISMKLKASAGGVKSVDDYPAPLLLFLHLSSAQLAVPLLCMAASAVSSV